ncbi:MAG TPA: GNAT family N-acetyltransferase [Herpetosiphonaceae bacterium]|nr:GNAT family N-acetyltransferase [Herpetosiphonaceae bacterium]
MPFIPPGAPIPELLDAKEFRLRPLRVSDVELDYAALMESKELLRRWSQSGWPADDFTLAQNAEDLEEHEREHDDRTAFTFTVLDPEEAECLGCVYIRPLAPLLRPEDIGKAAAEDVYQGRVAFWVRQSRLKDDLNHRLPRALIQWFERDWPFTTVVFFTSEGETRQRQVFEEQGLRLLHTAERQNDSAEPERYAIYGF